MNRRDFIGWFSVSALINILPVLLTACSFSKDEVQLKQVSQKNSKVARKDGFLVVGTTQMLSDQGIILDQKKADVPILVIRNPDNTNISAFNPTCPHKGCIVEWKTNTKMFSCPCHGAKFNADGKWIEGLIKRPLKSFETKEEEGFILVKLI
ncbi:ubiquinol-cytochrome c reductase iron-sulfur subunit [Nostoc sp. CALU 546]|uniref:QcrA and Rieske domain-containing protein n=1 Tax=Nostoc sp. CALU 546 TaxID=1867241 RepID=UPI003B66ED60